MPLKSFERNFWTDRGWFARIGSRCGSHRDRTWVAPLYPQDELVRIGIISKSEGADLVYKPDSF